MLPSLTEEDYLVAGRRLGYTLATFSIFATWFGAETLVGSGGREHALAWRLAQSPLLDRLLKP